MGVIRTEPIQVIAEAYDVAVDIAFPKGRVQGLNIGHSGETLCQKLGTWLTPDFLFIVWSINKLNKSTFYGSMAV